MSSYLVEIQPRELKFTFELQKQSSCTVRLANKTDQHVAFKVKTTSPKKYCVRPNVGVIQPKGTCEFVVTMQAQKSAPLDMMCKDKFLVQSRFVPAETMEEEITSDMFSKEDGNHIEERKLKVILVSPPHSSEFSPINGTLKQIPTNGSSVAGDKLLSHGERLVPHPVVDEHMEGSRMASNEDFKPVQGREFEPVKDVVLEPIKVVKSVTVKDVESKLNEDVEIITMKDEKDKGMKDLQLETETDMEQLKLVKDIEDMKTKLLDLESKISKAEVTISKLTEERRFNIQETEILQQELAMLRSRKLERRVQVGFPLLFVCMIAFVSVVLGYCFHA
ncbi:hypothetical protein Nepgr_001496 [Nepenthes gracilis]|uniref:MSP domain-containing protein n=1 Tax=Nepenthes gracilis TaxID=150966 RepID=A0AAD3RW41_NEPGR|nr:hypothetical protein Nepgr_001496 [Nepenthes gracilis]